MAAKASALTARALLNVSGDLPVIGTLAKAINHLVQVCDQSKCNKKASQLLQERLCYLTEHVFYGPKGLVAIIHSRPNDASLIALCRQFEHILQRAIAELERFTRGGFIKSILRGSKSQETFERLDRDITQCISAISLVLGMTRISEQAQIYDVVCNIQSKVDERGGFEGLLNSPAQLNSLAQEIGVDFDDLKTEVVQLLESFSAQAGVVDETSREMKAKVDVVREAVVMMQKATTTFDVSALQLSSHPTIDRRQVLGQGAFGKVYRGMYNHFEVAIKEMNIDGVMEKDFLREVAMHQKLGSLPGVVRIFGANFTTVPRFIVLELAAGTLHDALHKGSLDIDRSLPSKLSLLAQVCTTMSAISDMGILHRDLKPSNVLLFLDQKRVYAKISDFGLTKMTSESVHSNTGAFPNGTLPYMAPELFHGQYSSASDVYAFTVMLNEVLAEQVPFPGLSYVEIIRIVYTSHERPISFELNVTSGFNKELMRWIERCWHQDPTLRMKFRELAVELNHLLRRAVDAAKVGKQEFTNAIPRPPAAEIEASITMLTGWLISNCHLTESDALPLGRTLVTKKHVTSMPVLIQLLQDRPEFLSKELGVSVVQETSVLTTLGINTKLSASNPQEHKGNTWLVERLREKNVSQEIILACEEKLHGDHNFTSEQIFAQLAQEHFNSMYLRDMGIYDDKVQNALLSVHNDALKRFAANALPPDVRRRLELIYEEFAADKQLTAVDRKEARIRKIAATVRDDERRRRHNASQGPPAAGGDDDEDTPGNSPGTPREPCCPRCDRMTLIAAGKGHIACLGYAIHHYPIHADCCTAAAVGNYVDCLALLRENNAEWSEDTTRAAALYGSVDALQFLLESRCEYGDDLLYSAAKGGSLECVEYLVEDMLLETTADVFGAAFEHAHPECVQYLLVSGCQCGEYSFKKRSEWYLYRAYHTALDVDERFLRCILWTVECGWSLNDYGVFECPNLVGYILDNPNTFPLCKAHVIYEGWQA